MSIGLLQWLFVGGSLIFLSVIFVVIRTPIDLRTGHDQQGDDDGETSLTQPTETGGGPRER